MNTYYNTTQEQGDVLERCIDKATKQDEMILDFFRKFPGRKFTPHEVHINVFEDAVPITSVRRSITNLTNAGKLIKTSEKREGGYGRQSNTWMLKGRIIQTKLF